jgi:hypothetical protein
VEVRDWETTRLVDGLRTQLEQTWTFAGEALRGLTDEEYFWEPVDGCWNVRRRFEARTELAWGKGEWVVENAWQPPSPPPVTTISWRLMHGYDCLLDFVARGLHVGEQSWNDIEVPGVATAAVEMLATLVERLDSELARRVDEDLHRGAENMDRPAHAAVVFGIREATHHWAEAGVLRDLYRERNSKV